jgi:hypothetical protein
MYYRPGLKTTIWLELEVAREDSVQQRLRKGVDRRSGDMDHDDFHFFLPRLDYKTIDSMATPVGGGRQKVTGDGWRNGYLGYNSFFKARAMVAKLEQDREKAKFTSDDVYEVIKAIAGFVRTDGILTRRSYYNDTGGRRPGIPWGEMKATRAVWSKKTTVYEDREHAHDFVMDVLHAYNFHAEFIEDLMFSTKEGREPDEEQQKRSAIASNRFQDLLESAVKQQGSAKLKQTLIEHIGEFSDAASSIEFDYNHVKKIWQENVKQRVGTTQATSSRAA